MSLLVRLEDLKEIDTEQGHLPKCMVTGAPLHGRGGVLVLSLHLWGYIDWEKEK